MRWGSLALSMALLIGCVQPAIAGSEPSEDVPAQLAIHGPLSLEDKAAVRLTSKKPKFRQKLMNAVKKIPHPNLDQMNKFNTVTGFAMQMVQIIVSLKTGTKSVKLF